MKLTGLVLMVIGLATMTIRLGIFRYSDVGDNIEGSLLMPLAHLILLCGLMLLALHLVLRFVQYVFNHH